MHYNNNSNYSKQHRKHYPNNTSNSKQFEIIKAIHAKTCANRRPMS